MRRKIVSRCLLLALVIGVAAYNWLAYKFYGVDATMTQAVRDWQEEFPVLGPIVLFAGGLLYKHLFPAKES